MKRYAEQTADFLLDLTITALLTATTLLAVTASFTYPPDFASLCVSCLLFSALWCAVFRTRASTAVGLSAIGLGLLLLLFAYFSMPDFRSAANGYAGWLYDSLLLRESANRFFSVLTNYLIALGFSLAFYFFTAKYMNFLLMVGVFGLPAIVYETFLGGQPPYYYFFITASLFLYYVRSRQFWASRKKVRPGEALLEDAAEKTPSLNLLPALFLTALILFASTALPRDLSKRVELPNGALTLYNHIYNGVYNLLNPVPSSYLFGVDRIGFRSGTGRMGYPLNNTADIPVMRVSVKADGVYLRGATYDTYTGMSWTDTIPTNTGPVVTADTSTGAVAPVSSSEFALNLLEYGLAKQYVGSVADLSPENRTLYTNIFNATEQRGATVVYEKLSTYSIFMTPIISTFWNMSTLPFTQPVSILQDERGSGLRGDVLLEEGYGYYLEYFDFKRNHSRYPSLLRAFGKGYYGTLEDENSKRIYGIDNLRQLSERAGQINARYLTLPASLPPSVTDLAKRLTEGQATEYDAVSAIESYLKKNFPYDTATTPPPTGADFTADFLFEQKKGYCVHFATAMTVLCRAAGYPARYVEGFVTPEKGDDGWFHITTEQAHAWPEVYFEGLGWISFEPTPGISTGSAASSRPEGQGLHIVDPQETGPNTLLPTPPVVPPPSQPVEEAPTAASFLPWLLPPALLAALLLANHLRASLRIKRIRARTGDKAAFVRGFSLVLRAASLAGYRRAPDETLLEYCAHIDRDLPNDLRLSALCLAFCRVTYGGGSPTARDASALAMLLKCFRSLLRSLEINPLMLFVQHFLLGRL